MLRTITDPFSFISFYGADGGAFKNDGRSAHFSSEHHLMNWVCSCLTNLALNTHLLVFFNSKSSIALQICVEITKPQKRVQQTRMRSLSKLHLISMSKINKEGGIETIWLSSAVVRAAVSLCSWWI